MKRSNFGVRIGHGITFLVLVFIVSFTPITTHASTGFFTNLWCNVTELFGFTCESNIITSVPEVTVVPSSSIPPPLPPAQNYQIINSTTETPNTTIVEEHHTTNPTTVIYQTTTNDDKISDAQFLNLFQKLTALINQTNQQTPIISRDLFTKQVDKIYEKSNDSTDNVQENLDTIQAANSVAFSTDLLTVTGNTDIDGNTTVGGDLTVDGSITAGMLNVSALASAGALVAPYFTATSTLDVNSFMGNVGIGTTTPSSKLTVVGDIDISAGSAYKYNGANVINASTTLNNYFFGGAGNLTMTGANNIASGYQAFYLNTTGYSNSAYGVHALYSNTTGYWNTANGSFALQQNTTGAGNTANGASSLRFNTTGSSNTAYGMASLYLNTTGSNNTAIGVDAIKNNVSGSYNTAIGQVSLYSNTIGSYNTALGHSAGYDINTATSTGANTVIGYNTGRGIVTGINNTILGANVTGLSSTLSNNIIIADGAGNQRINVTSAGNVGIGTTTPTNKLTVQGDINISDTTTGYKIGNNRILYASTTNLSTLAGNGAGNALLSDGLYNTALGHQSLFTATSSDYNTAVGYHSLYSNTTGSYNTANGVQSLYANTTGNSNTTDGFQSLVFNTTGSDNTASGYRSMYSNTTGNYNTANGRESLYFNTTGTHNVAYGRSALLTNTTGSNNTANGVYALYSNTIGDNNTALGYNAGRFIADGFTGNATTSNSVFLGYDTRSLTANDTNQIVIGYTAIGNGSNSVTLGNTNITKTVLQGNVGIGTSTPQSKLFVYDTDRATNAIANVNIMTSNTQSAGMGGSIGFGGLNDVGSTNPYIFGKIEGVSQGSTGWSGALLFSTTDTGSSVSEKMRITSEGKVGIGTTSPSAKLTVTQSAQSATGGFWLSTSDNTDFRSQFMDTSGVLSFYGGDTAGTLNTATLNAAGEWTNASDISYKENIENLSNGLDIALALKPRTYDIKNTDNHRIGFIAQEVEGIVPEVVGGAEGSKGISYGNLVAVAISAIQELAEKISGFANIFKSDRIETKILCVGGTCLTEAELLDLMNNSNQKQAPANVSNSNSEELETEVISTSTENNNNVPNPEVSVDATLEVASESVIDNSVVADTSITESEVISEMP